MQDFTKEEARQFILDNLESYLQRYTEFNPEHPKRPFSCPNPGHEDKHPSASLFVTDNGVPVVKCFTCNETWNTLDLIAMQTGKDKGAGLMSEAFKIFGLVVDGYDYSTGEKIEIKPKIKRKEKPKIEKVYDFTEEAEKALIGREDSEKAQNHYKKRGLTQDTIDTAGLGYWEAGYNDLLKNYPDLQTYGRDFYKYIFPTFSGKNRDIKTLIFETSDREAKGPKYIKITGVSDHLYNEFYFEDPPEDDAPVFIVEGPYDALSIEQVGGHAVALLGVGTSSLERMIKKNRPRFPLIISLDNDKAGKNGTEKIKKLLECEGLPYIVRTVEAIGVKDANEALLKDPEAFKKWVKETEETAKTAPITPKQKKKEQTPMTEQKTDKTTKTARFTDPTALNLPIWLKSDEKEKPRPLTVTGLNAYYKRIGVSLKLNEISHEIEIETEQPALINPQTKQVSESALNNLPQLARDALQYKFTGRTIATIEACNNIIASQHAFNPVFDMLKKGGPWDGVNRLPVLFEIIGIDGNGNDNALSRILVKKWLFQCLALAHNGEDRRHMYGADGVLVLQGPQGIGKTSLFNKLGIDKQLSREGMHLDIKDKDTIIQCNSYWMCELGELESTFKHDIEGLKAFFTQAEDLYRMPYDRHAVKRPRKTSFFATCNSVEFLVDITDNRRFWTIPVTDIDLKKLKAFDAVQLWEQINAEYEKAEDKQSLFRLTREERKALSARNRTHQKPVKGQAEVEDVFRQARAVEAGEIEAQYDIEWRYMTVKEFQKDWYLDDVQGVDVGHLGRALTAMGVNLKRDKKRGRVRLLPKKITKSRNLS
jgi:5S rRNA maturation endonuclease (ribonuclease M5)